MITPPPPPSRWQGESFIRGLTSKDSNYKPVMKPLRETFRADTVHDKWEAVYRGNPIQDRLNEMLLDRIIADLGVQPGSIFLDAGCGTGDHTARLARRGFRCVGVDISETVLQKARERINEAGFSAQASFICQPLENLALPNDHFDAIHARGVLMHIPEWEKALKQLVRVLKPRGKIVILELNDQSLESWIVKMIRVVRTGRSRVNRTNGGIEFWSEEGGHPFVARVASIGYLQKYLTDMGVRTIRRRASEFWDINRFPEGVLRNTSIRFNMAWFSLRLPAAMSSGNMIIGEKWGKSG
jgi:ubiquinone/menaquinone biosynthesis C-methylase UbiE